jgi:hypothetical protein
VIRKFTSRYSCATIRKIDQAGRQPNEQCE